MKPVYVEHHRMYVVFVSVHLVVVDGGYGDLPDLLLLLFDLCIAVLM